jgi:hypothetical protein
MTQDTTTVSGDSHAGPDVKVDSLDDVISKTLAETGYKDDYTPAATVAEPEQDADKGSTEQADIPETADKKEEAEGSTDILLAPENWPSKRKELFAKLPTEVKQDWIEQEKEYRKGLSKSGAQAKNWEAIEPLMQHIPANQRTQVAGDLFKLWGVAEQNPEVFIDWFMKRTGLTPEKLQKTQEPKVESQTQGWQDPSVKQVQDQMAQLVAERNQEKHSKYVNEMSNFLDTGAIEAKDSSGNRLYPHYDGQNGEIGLLMDEIVRATPALQAMHYKDAFQNAYDIAVGRSHSRLIERELAKTAQARENEKAKVASTIKPGVGSNGNMATGKKTLDDIIAETLKAHGY